MVLQTQNAWQKDIFGCYHKYDYVAMMQAISKAINKNGVSVYIVETLTTANDVFAEEESGNDFYNEYDEFICVVSDDHININEVTLERLSNNSYSDSEFEYEVIKTIKYSAEEIIDNRKFMIQVFNMLNNNDVINELNPSLSSLLKTTYVIDNETIIIKETDGSYTTKWNKNGLSFEIKNRSYNQVRKHLKGRLI